jgi:phosphatidylserine decarboxylase
MFTLRALREAKFPIIILLVLAAAAAVWSLWAAACPLALVVLTLGFFRDPPRRIPADPAAILSPADGTVVAIGLRPGKEFVGADARRIAIFLSVFDVHVQRAPIRGRIAWVRYQPGEHVDARREEAGLRNEHRTMGLVGEDGFRVEVRQIAGLVARRIVGWAGEGAELARGERLGMIRFGSRVELVIPAGVDIVVRVGEHVKGGETILARRT